MLKKIGLIAFVYIGALACAVLLGSVAKAITASPDNENNELTAMAICSEFKTFGDFAKWLQVDKLANDQELRAIENSLKKNDLDYKSKMVDGIFTPKRMSWDDVYLAKILVGDWKTTGGRILVAHKDTSVDGLFDQAMKTFDPKSAQNTKVSLFIESAHAISTARARASAAAAWTWLMVAARHTSAEIGVWGWHNSIGRVECSDDGKYMINTGWKASDKSFHAQKIDDVPLDPKLVEALQKKDPMVYKKCTDVSAAAATKIYQSPGLTPGEKIKNSGEFNYGMASVLDEAPRHVQHAAR